MKPKNRAQLVRYLAANPNLIINHPGGVGYSVAALPITESRVFIRMQANQFVFKKPDGRESYLDCKASELSFDDNGFNVKFPPEWKDLADKSIRYDYAEAAVLV
jgi:hypothetical protein